MLLTQYALTACAQRGGSARSRDDDYASSVNSSSQRSTRSNQSVASVLSRIPLGMQETEYAIHKTHHHHTYIY